MAKSGSSGSNRAHPKPSRGKSKPHGASSKAKSQNKWDWLNLPVVIAVIGFLGILAGVLLDHSLSQSSQANPGSPHLELDSLTVVPATYPHPVTLDFKLRNIGNQLAIITGVRVTVQRYERLARCVAQGDLPVTGHYQRTMPVDPRPGSSVTIPVSQQAGPDSADQFEVKLYPAPDRTGAIRLYDTSISLLYDKSRVPVSAGAAIVALPSYPPYDSRSEYYWTRQEQRELGTQGRNSSFARYMALYANEAPSISRCLIANSKGIRGFLSSVRSSPELAHIADLMAYCCVTKPPTISVLSCGRRLIKSSELSIGCSGSVVGIRLQHMRWSSWGWTRASYKGKATGTGIVQLLDCRTTSSRGRWKPYMATVTFSDPQYVRYGWIWNAVNIRLTGDHPGLGNDIGFPDLKTPISSTCEAQ